MEAQWLLDCPAGHTWTLPWLEVVERPKTAFPACPICGEEADDDLQRLVDEQAKDEALWFMAATVPEGYLQQELRKLHKAVEEHQCQR